MSDKNEANKEKITVRFDVEVIEGFKELAKQTPGGKYQALMNDALREHLQRNKDGGIDARLKRLENLVLKKR